MSLELKRAYDEPANSDGCRVLVDRVWPRGVSKAAAKIDQWRKEFAPSTELRKWFAHKPERWPEFKKRYFAELDNQREALAEFRKLANCKTVTLIYGARDTMHNQAVALKEYLETRA